MERGDNDPQRFALYSERGAYYLIDCKRHEYNPTHVAYFVATVFTELDPLGIDYNLSSADLRRVLQSDWFEASARITSAPVEIRNGLWRVLRNREASAPQRVALC